jgi:excinuclease ABC subunit A
MANPNSLTGQYISGAMGIPVPAERRKGKKGKRIRVVGARGNNLKDVTADIPLGTFTCVTPIATTVVEP